MRLLLVLFALQSQPAVRATTADSAAARAALLQGLAAFDSVSTDTDQQFTLKRYLEQLLTWNMNEEGNQTVLRFDRAATRAWQATSIWAADWLWLLLGSGDTLTSERFIAAIPERARDMQMNLAAQALLWDRRALSRPDYDRLVDWLESRMTSPSQRAELIASRANFTLHGDSTAGCELYRQAIRLSQSDTAEMWFTYKWMIALLKTGEQIPLDSIVHAAMYAQKRPVDRKASSCRRIETARVVAPHTSIQRRRKKRTVERGRLTRKPGRDSLSARDAA